MMTTNLSPAFSQQFLVKWTPTEFPAFQSLQSSFDDDFDDESILRWLKQMNIESDIVWGKKRFSKGKEYGKSGLPDTFKRKKPKVKPAVNLIPTALWLTTLQPSVAKSEPIRLMYQWREIDFEFKTDAHKSRMLLDRSYIPENVVPLGLEVWRNKIFVTFPSFKSGRPVSLATVPRYGWQTSPQLKPYPNWNFHSGGFPNCSRLTSVFRLTADNCDRLWVLDSGVSTLFENASFICPPSIFVFDLHTDALLAKYELPNEIILEGSLFANIAVDSSFPDCSDLHAYIADTLGFALIVFREIDRKFWKFVHPFFYPDPEASFYNLHGVQFQWTDGIFGMALGPPDYKDQRYLYFHSLSSYREVAVSTAVLRDPFKVGDSVADFFLLGEKKRERHQSSASAIDRNGVMFFGMVAEDSIGCWDINKNHEPKHIGIVSRDAKSLIFPNDVKVDKEYNQNVWIISTRLPLFQASLLRSTDYNFRIFFGNTEEVVAGTICDSTRS